MRNRYLKRISRSPSLQAPKSPCWRLNAPVPLVTTTLLLKLSWGLTQGVVSAAQRMVRWPHCIPGWPPSGNITVLGLLLVVAGWREFGSCSVFWLLHWSPHLWSPTHSPVHSPHTLPHTRAFLILHYQIYPECSLFLWALFAFSKVALGDWINWF